MRRGAMRFNEFLKGSVDMLTPQWICADGTSVRLKRMSTAHILNVLRYLHTADSEHGPMVIA